MSETAKKVIIVGGVAGGMSCAARARRLSENSEIIIFERGLYPSFANCGLPYHIGGEITDKSKLIVQSAESLRARHRLDVRTLTEVISIDRGSHMVRARNLQDGSEYNESYDALVLSPGAAPLRPPIPGIDRPGHFTLRNIPDMEAILEWAELPNVRRAVIGGGGYIGLEMAEQLVQYSLQVSIVEMAPQVMAPLDEEMAAMLHTGLKKNGVDLHIGNGLDRFEDPAEEAIASRVILKDGTALPADLVILGLGVKPESKLAADAGLEVGARGGIVVNAAMQTSDPNVYAVGDAVEVTDAVTGEKAQIPLAGPANRQGRMVADRIFGLSEEIYRGTQGTAVLRLFELTAACTGPNERTLTRLGRPYEVVRLHPASHASYFPGAKPIALKVIFDPANGLVLGAQAVGEEGVEKRIDVIATAIYAGLKMDDLARLELCYAPPFGSAKDPVNLAGMIGQNVQRGLVRQIQWNDVDEAVAKEGAVIVDVRDPGERISSGHYPESIPIPLNELRDSLDKLPRDRPVVVHCASGQRSYFASRILAQHGFSDVRNLAGSWKTVSAAKAE